LSSKRVNCGSDEDKGKGKDRGEEAKAAFKRDGNSNFGLKQEKRVALHS